MRDFPYLLILVEAKGRDRRGSWYTEQLHYTWCSCGSAAVYSKEYSFWNVCRKVNEATLYGGICEWQPRLFREGFLHSTGTHQCLRGNYVFHFWLQLCYEVKLHLISCWLGNSFRKLVPLEACGLLFVEIVWMLAL